MVYIVVNEGEIVMATRDEGKALSFAIDANNEDIAEIVEDSGRDMDDLTDDELNEFAFQAGFEGGCYTVEEVTEEDFETLDEIKTAHGDTFTISEIAELLVLEDEELEFDEFDGFDDFDEFDGFDESDKSDDLDEFDDKVDSSLNETDFYFGE